MLVQMRSPFSGQWLKIDAEDGSIIELAEVGWQDIPQLPAIAMPSQGYPTTSPRGPTVAECRSREAGELLERDEACNAT